MNLSLKSSRRVDGGLFFTALALVLVSGVAIVSASTSLNRSLVLRHLTWVAIGMMCYGFVSRMRYRRWADVVWIAYVLSLLALIVVRMAGAMRLGSTRWLSLFGMSVQPSELAKLTTAWLLARYLAGQPSPLPPRVLWISLALVGPPALLVFIQPDFGSASVFGAIWLGMIWVAGLSRRTLGGLMGGIATLVPLGWHLLKDYQRDRLLAFLDPYADPLGAGFSVIQSTIAIGSGQLLGRGWFAGTQNRLSFLPERHSDFIFSVIGEEWGFLGCLVVVILFGVLLARTLHLASHTTDPQGRLLAIGIFSWLAYQAIVNIGMVMGLFPVVGVPLPLISYGGSSMVTVWVALGLLQSIRRADIVE